MFNLICVLLFFQGTKGRNERPPPHLRWHHLHLPPSSSAIATPSLSHVILGRPFLLYSWELYSKACFTTPSPFLKKHGQSTSTLPFLDFITPFSLLTVVDSSLFWEFVIPQTHTDRVLFSTDRTADKFLLI